MYIVLSILIVVLLIAIFTASFVANRRTPVPKGCEYIIANSEKCMRCGNPLCKFSGNNKEE